MKKTLLVASIALLSSALEAQAVKDTHAVGIDTNKPRATLDVNGDVRVQKTETAAITGNEACPCFLVVDANGLIKKVPIGNGTGIGDGTGSGSGNGSGSGSGNGSGSGSGGGTISGGSGNLGGTASANINNAESYVVSFEYNINKLQGVINNSDKTVSVRIPYTNGSGQYNTTTITSKTAVASAQNGQSAELKLTIPSGTLSSSGYIEGTITAASPYNVKRLAPGKKQTVATFDITMSGVTRTVKLVAIGGVPDRNFDDPNHKFVYIPVTVTKGSYNKVWLNNNLGADYANVNSPVFNPTKQATSRDDYHAYGSLFQWQRKADGHELITWSGASNGTPKQGTTTTLASSWANAGTSKFITSSSSNDYNWVRNGSSVTSGPNVQLWRANGSNNPCPVGYHVPTKADWVAYHKAITGSESNLSNGKFWDGFNADILRLPAAGYRYNYGALGNQSSSGYYWSSESSTSGSRAWDFRFLSSYSSPSYYDYRAYGSSVRCLQD